MMINNNELSRTIEYVKDRFFKEPAYTKLFEQRAVFKIEPRPGCIVSKETIIDLLKVVHDYENKKHRPDPIFSRSIYDFFKNIEIPAIKENKTVVHFQHPQERKFTYSFVVQRCHIYDHNMMRVLVIDVVCNPRDYDSSFFSPGYGICCQKIPMYKKIIIYSKSLMQKSA